MEFTYNADPGTATADVRQLAFDEIGKHPAGIRIDDLYARLVKISSCGEPAIRAVICNIVADHTVTICMGDILALNAEGFPSKTVKGTI